MTVAIGADYRKALAPGLDSKKLYALLWKYPYLEFGDEIYDSERPPAWYKIKALLQYLKAPGPKTEWVFLSDADVMITDPFRKLETMIADVPPEANLVWTLDAVGHLNSGNLFIRTSQLEWCKSYFERIWSMTDYNYHLWWENAAMILLFMKDEDVRAHTHTVLDSSRFNAYLTDIEPDDVHQNIADLIRDEESLQHWLTTPRRTVYEKGDFLIHFAGIRDTSTISRIMTHILTNEPDADLYRSWLRTGSVDDNRDNSDNSESKGNSDNSTSSESKDQYTMDLKTMDASRPRS